MGDRSDQEEKRGNQKGRELASQLSIPYVLSTVWIPQRCSKSYTEKREGGDRGDQEEKTGNKNGREQASQ